MKRTKQSLAASRLEPVCLARRETALLYGVTLTWLAVWISLAPGSKRHLFFKEGGPIDWLSSVLLLAAALLAWATWVHRRRGEVANWFWIISAAGLFFLSLDERFQFHESSRLILTPLFGLPPDGVKNWNDAAVIGYGVVAIAIFAVALPAVLRHRGTRNFLALAVILYAMHTVADTLSRSSAQVILEESAKLLANASLVIAFLESLRAKKVGSPAKLGIERRHFVWIFGIALALGAAMLTNSTALQEALLDKWGQPTFWLQSVCLAVAAWFFGFVGIRGEPARSISERVMWIATGLLCAWLGFGLALRACLDTFGEDVVRELLPGLLRRSYGPFHDPFGLSGALGILATVLLALAGTRVLIHGRGFRWFVTGMTLSVAVALLGTIWHRLPYAVSEIALILGCTTVALGSVIQLAGRGQTVNDHIPLSRD